MVVVQNVQNKRTRRLYN
ncbi:Protein of unknown function [Bacillus mycoides]|uniref:Uncharacterized protein n=1 Tax=Bacillus mycoides TaxID=1405 RepID=A0A1G4EW24_BACMY|nr:Protein of unknown function [Bacillus mycoides]